jgi:hypothetical protein
VPLPLFTAESALYRTSQTYVTAAAGHSAAGWGNVILRRSPCDEAYERCAAQAQTTFDQATYRCQLLGGQACAAFYQGRLTADLAACAAQFLCDAAADCQVDRVSGFEARCCPGQQACGGRCVPPCPARKVIPLNDAACQCVCDPLLAACEPVYGGPQRVRDPETCLCRCLTDAEAPCEVIGAVRDPATCLCQCLYPFSPCNGRCVNLQADIKNCGSCGTECGPDQACCDGVCTTLTSDQDCGRCGTNLQPPWKCCVPQGSTRGFQAIIGSEDHCQDCFDECGPPSLGCCPPDQAHATNYCDPGPTTQHCGWCDQARSCVGREVCCRTPGAAKPPQFHCADLVTSDKDCGTCGNACAAGRRCDGGTCVCLRSQTPCGRTLPSGPEACCSGGRASTCCSGRCVNIDTDPRNCGACGTVCPSGKVCVGGACVCPSGSTTCGVGCCPPAGGPASNRDCCAGACVDTRTDIAHCGACGQRCAVIGYTYQGMTVQVTPTCAGGTCVCPAGTSLCAGRWCRPNVLPGTNRPMQCCPPSAEFPGGYACPTDLWCCGILKSGTNLGGCCSRTP